jgi:sulfur-oxidizing protein SoxZ
METGFRYTEDGKRIPRDIIRVFTCIYNGEEVFKTDFYSGVGANPLVIFTTIALASGTIECRWTGDNAYEAVSKVNITVS